MVALAMMEQEKLLLLAWDKINADPRCQARVEIHAATVIEYAEAYAAGTNFPAVVVFYDGESYWLADGFTRRQACKRIKRKHTDAVVKPGGLRDAILYAVGANTNHGLRRTNDDKHRSVRILLLDDEWMRWSNSEIARRCGVSEHLIRVERRILAQVEDKRKVRRGVSEYEMDVSGLTEAQQFEDADKRARTKLQQQRYLARLAKAGKLANRLRRLHAGFGESASDGLEAIDSYLLCLEKLR